MSAISAARRAAFAALRRFEDGETADAALARALAETDVRDPRDRALATTLVYGTVRRLRTIDHVLGQLASRPLARIDPPARTALRLGVYQILWLDRVPGHALVYEAVEQTRRASGRGAAAFVNAVLRALLREPGRVRYPDRERDPIGYLGVVHSHPDWLVRRYLSRLGLAEAQALCEANNASPPVTLRVNRRRAGVEQVARALEGVDAVVETGRYLPEALRVRAQARPDQLPGFADGWFTPQDEASMLVGHVLSPSPGDRVLDACAAPGTKTTQLAERMDDRGEVAALDTDRERLRRVEENARRLGLGCIRTRIGDARRTGAWFRAGWANRVLVDAPCSGLGTLSRRPDLRWRKREADLASLAELQIAILCGVAPVVRPGGILVYSTCTTEPEENQEVIAAFLRMQPGFRPVDLNGRLPEGLTGEAGGWLQLWPHRHGTDGFFIACLERVADD